MCLHILIGCKWSCLSAIVSRVMHIELSCSIQSVSLVDLSYIVYFCWNFYIDVDCEFLDMDMFIMFICGDFTHCIAYSLFVLWFVLSCSCCWYQCSLYVTVSHNVIFHSYIITISILKDTMVCFFFILYERYLNFCGCLELWWCWNDWNYFHPSAVCCYTFSMFLLCLKLYR
jgi:hypothetical protein